MPYRDVSTNAIDIKKSQCQPFEGVLKGSHEIITKLGKQVVWEFMGEDGVGFGIFGFTNLNRALESIEPGAQVKIIYTGTKICNTKFGMKDVHQVSVAIWEDGDPTL